MAAKKIGPAKKDAKKPAARPAPKAAANLPAPAAKSAPAPAALGGLSGLREVDVRITVEWGRTEITVEEAMQLGEQGLLRVDRLARDPVDVRVNGKLFARGKLVVVGDKYGVQLTEIVDGEG